MIIPAVMGEKTIGILGLGRSGLASAAALVAAGADIYAHDDNAHARPDMPPPDSPPSDLPGGVRMTPWQNWPWGDMSSLIISPGIPHRHPKPHPAVSRAEAEGVEVISDIELLMRAGLKSRIIGITGTNGKSTTALLLGHILNACGIKAHVGGNIGTAALAMEDPGAGGVLVLELSSYQLETTPGLMLDAGAVINITPDHLDRHGGWEGYVAAKALLAGAVREDGLLVLGGGDALNPMAEAAKAKVHRIAPDDAPACIPDPINPALTGPHNRENTAIAFKLALAMGGERGRMTAALDTFNGLPHRMEVIAHSGGIAFINDSKATNAAAAKQALLSFPSIYWIAGGEAKDGGLEPLVDALNAVRRAYLIGAAAGMFADTLKGRVAAKICGTLDVAVESALADARRDARYDARNDADRRPDDSAPATILLSPAAASFDQFDDFEMRGDAFRALALTLTTGLEGAASQAQTQITQATGTGGRDV